MPWIKMSPLSPLLQSPNCAIGTYGRGRNLIFPGMRTMYAHDVTCPKPWHGLFERLIRELDLRQSPEWDCTETGLPSAVYTDPGSIRPN